MDTMDTMDRSGFSLVELSIVLVILGLLTGGVLTGQSLIRAAEMRSVTNDVTRFRVAVHTFRAKYFALPGDMANATDFWGLKNADLALCTQNAATDKATCDGNGDGKIQTSGNGDNQDEWWLSWQHLANAGLIEGQYSGIGAFRHTAGAQHGANPSVNSPAPKISGAGYILRWFEADETHTNYFALANNHIQLGKVTSVMAGSNLDGPVITGEEAWNIDKKVDDSRPAYGFVRTFKNGGTMGANNCSTTADPTTSEYNVSNTDIICALTLIMDF